MNRIFITFHNCFNDKREGFIFSAGVYECVWDEL